MTTDPTDPTAQSAPAPAPVAVPEGMSTDQFVIRQFVAWLSGAHEGPVHRGTANLIDAMRDNGWSRPEPVTAADLGDFPGREPAGCCHTPGGRGLDRDGCYRCFVETRHREPVTAPLPSEEPGPVVLDRHGDAWQRGPEDDEGWWCTAPDTPQGITIERLIARYGPLRPLVPEDDEDTVRLADGVRALAAEHDAWAERSEAIVREFTEAGSDPDEDPICENRQAAEEYRAMSARLRGLLDDAGQRDEDTVRVPRHAIDELREARRNDYPDWHVAVDLVLSSVNGQSAPQEDEDMVRVSRSAFMALSGAFGEWDLQEPYTDLEEAVSAFLHGGGAS